MLRAVLPGVMNRLGPAVLALLFLLVEFWDLIPWGLWRARLADDPDRAALLGMGLVTAWILAFRPTLADLRTHPALAPWWRTSPSSWRRGLAITPALLVISAPILVAGLLFPQPLLFGAAAVLLGGLAGSRPWLVVPAAILLALGHPLAPLFFAASPSLAGLAHRHPVRSKRESGVRGPRARGGVVPLPAGLLVHLSPLMALVHRDALTLWRRSRSLLQGALIAALPPALFTWGLRRNGANDATVATATATLICAVSPLAAVALSRVRHQQGSTFFLRRWPPGPGLRVLSLLVVALGVLAPTSAALAAAPCVAGPCAPLAPLGVAAVACAAGAVAVLRSRAPLGWHLGWVLVVVILVLLGGVESTLGQLGLVGLGLHLGRRALERG